MATYPALVQLLRLLGRDEALSAMGLADEPEPDALTAHQRAQLAALLEARLDAVAVELAQEAAASDDVGDRRAAERWLEERIAAFADLLGDGQAERLSRAAAAAVEDWG